ncbi:MAG: DUF58 domain-containing protein [Microscillaceae bacterium]|nr:DUF58 domain-containing protein [Microscillaceae bacterium]
MRDDLGDLAQIREFGNIEFLAKQLVEGFITGLHRSPFHGFSVEFAEHQLYNTGESTRHVDWKVFAKTDRLYTKRYEEETNLRCQLVVDVSSSMFYPLPHHGKLTFSLLAASAIAYMLQKQRDAVSLCTFSQNIDTHTPTRSTPTHIHKIFTILEGLLHEPGRKKDQATAIAPVLHQLADKIHRRSLVVIFSDMFEGGEDPDEIFSALQHLRHNRHEILLFHVTEQKTERAFQFEERPHIFIDLETGEKIKLQPSQVQAYYQKHIEAFYKQLKLKCGQYKIDFIEADIARGFDQILSAYLIKRNKMR